MVITCAREAIRRVLGCNLLLGSEALNDWKGMGWLNRGEPEKYPTVDYLFPTVDYLFRTVDYLFRTVDYLFLRVDYLFLRVDYLFLRVDYLFRVTLFCWLKVQSIPPVKVLSLKKG